MFSYRLLVRIARGPAWLAHLVLRIAVPIMFLALRRTRRAVTGNLEAVLGPCGWWGRQRRIWRTFQNYAWCTLERYQRVAGGRTFESRFENVDSWKEAASRGGFVMVTAHVGSWEAGSTIPSTDYDHEVHVVREPEMDPRAQELTRELLGEDARYKTHFAGEDPSLGFELLRALREGAIVALQGDRPRQDGRTASVAFFGRTLEFPLGPAALARAAGVPMLPVFVFREGRLRYRVVFRPPIGPDVQTLASEVEWAIREDPYQWFCWRSLWGGRSTNVPSEPSATTPSASRTEKV